MFSPSFAFIVNSFNRLELLKGALDALFSWIPGSEFGTECVIVVFDAGSTDGTIGWLEEIKPAVKMEIILPEPGDDTSFSAGVNKAADYILSRYGSITYLVFYETDNQILSAEPFRRALAQLQGEAKLGACGFTVRQHDGSPAGVGQPFPKIGNFLLGKNIVYKFQLESMSYRWHTTVNGTEFSPADIVYTSPLMVKVGAWKESGGLDAETFPFSDCDVDWAKRLKNLGWSMGVIRTDQVIHDNMNSISAWSGSRAMQYHRGRLRYFKRFHPRLVLLIWPVLLSCRHLLELTVSVILVEEPARRKQLRKQFAGLLKACYRSYEQG